MPTRATNTCAWLVEKTRDRCGKKCIDEYCYMHAYLLRNSKHGGTNPCRRCGIGVRGIVHLCDDCGRKTYRSVMWYYRRSNRLPPSVDEFLERRYITHEPSNQICQCES